MTALFLAAAMFTTAPQFQFWTDVPRLDSSISTTSNMSNRLRNFKG